MAWPCMDRCKSCTDPDVYTCGTFDPNAVIEHIKVWDPVKVEYKYLDREHKLEEIKF